MAKKMQSICFTESITLSKEYIDEHLADIVHFKCDTSSDADNDYLNVNILMVENGELVEKHDKFYDPGDLMYAECSRTEQEGIDYLIELSETNGMFDVVEEFHYDVSGFRKGVKFKFKNNAWLICAGKETGWDFCVSTKMDLLPYNNDEIFGMDIPTWSLVNDFSEEKHEGYSREEWALIRALANDGINYRGERMNVIDYIKYCNHDSFNWSEDLQDECLTSLWRFRLEYAKEKMVNNRMQRLFARQLLVVNELQEFAKKHFKKDTKHETNLVVELSRIVGEDLRKVYTKLKTVEYDDYYELNDVEDVMDMLGERAKDIFAKPQLVRFSDEDDDKICEQIMKMDYVGMAVRVDGIYCYLANYLEFLDTKTYAKILPVAFHIVEAERENGTESLDEAYADLFWIASEVINEYWKMLPDDEKLQKDLRDKIYKAYWPKVGDMWPIVNSEIIKFRDESRQRVFDEALGWILSLDDICDRNRELGKYLENLVAKHRLRGYDRTLNPKVVWRAFRMEQTEINYATYVDDAYECGAGEVLLYPETVEQAELALEDWARYDDCMDFSWLERLMITGNPEGVGEYIINYLVEHFGIFKKLSEAMAIFTAACMGASEKSEILPLEKFANEIRDMKGYKKSSGDLLNKAMDLAREKVKIVEFQRKNIYD